MCWGFTVSDSQASPTWHAGGGPGVLRIAPGAPPRTLLPRYDLPLCISLCFLPLPSRVPLPYHLALPLQRPSRFPLPQCMIPNFPSNIVLNTYICFSPCFSEQWLNT